MTSLDLKAICDKVSKNLEWPPDSEPLTAGLADLANVLDVDRLAKIAGAVQAGGAVAVTFATQDYLEIAIEWTKAIRSCNLSNYLIVCGDSLTYDALAARGIPAIRAHIDASAWPESFRGFYGFTAMGLAMVALKFPVIKAILAQGYDVVLSDVDAFWARDPFPHFPKDVDMAFQRVAIHPPEVVEYWGFSVCTGFVYFHNSPATHSFLESCISWNSRLQCDQVAANLALISAGMQWNLPEGYAQQLPITVQKAPAQFSAFSSFAFRGVSAIDQFTALALSPRQFWRHTYFPPTKETLICHPNSPREASGKLEVINRWMDCAR